METYVGRHSLASIPPFDLSIHFGAAPNSPFNLFYHFKAAQKSHNNSKGQLGATPKC